MSDRSPRKQMVFVQPIVLGGSPTDPANRREVDRAEHMKLVRYWNRVIRELKAQQQGR